MSARPCLVSEGTPIYSNEDVNCGSAEHDLQQSFLEQELERVIKDELPTPSLSSSVPMRKLQNNKSQVKSKLITRIEIRPSNANNSFQGATTEENCDKSQTEYHLKHTSQAEARISSISKLCDHDSRMICDEENISKEKRKSLCTSSLNTANDIPSHGSNAFPLTYSTSEASNTAAKNSFQSIQEMKFHTSQYMHVSQHTHLSIIKPQHTQSQHDFGKSDEMEVDDVFTETPIPHQEILSPPQILLDTTLRLPLIVLDGANIAYSYARENHPHNGTKFAPDYRGIDIAVKYFLHSKFLNDYFRIQVVIPAQWMRSKPRAVDASIENALMQTDQLDILQNLKRNNMVFEAPPRDDDDAYVLTIARRADYHTHNFPTSNMQHYFPLKGGYVVSNDLFRDAITRDTDAITRERHLKKNYNIEYSEVVSLRHWLESGGRISYSFFNFGITGDAVDLVFQPYPRHSLIEAIERQRHL